MQLAAAGGSAGFRCKNKGAAQRSSAAPIGENSRAGPPLSNSKYGISGSKFAFFFKKIRAEGRRSAASHVRGTLSPN
jgi:hypothetical protein